MIKINKLLNLYQQYKSERASMESVWRDIALYVCPARSDFFTNDNKKADLYDSTAVIASQQLTSAVWGLLNNRSSRWFKLYTDNPNKSMQEWVKLTEDAIYKSINNKDSIFYSRLFEFYNDVICYGTGIFYIGENISENRLYYATRHVNECYLGQNDVDEITTIIREFKLTASEANKLFNCNYSEAKSEEIKFIHIVMPAEDNDIGYKFVSYYINVAKSELVSSGGYYEFPYQVARWSSRTSSAYGESPAMGIMADIKMLNSISKTLLIATQKQVDPPLLTTDEMHVGGIRTSPGGIIYGGLDPITGQKRFEPLLNGSDLSYAIQIQEQKRNAINQAFLYNYLKTSSNVSSTATEALINKEERIRLLSPIIGRLQSEFLYPLLIRQTKLMIRLGLIPSPPVNDSDISIAFVGVWNEVENSVASVGLQNILSFIERTAALNPDIKKSFNFLEMCKEATKSFGINTNNLWK